MMMALLFRPTKWDEKVEQVCQAWEGTPYKLNRSVKGVGVDCLHFAASVLDALYGEKHSKNLNSLPPDACVHNRAGVISAGRALLQAYDVQRVEDRTIEAGDLVLFGRSSGVDTTQHLMVAGSSGRLWHATTPRVHFTGLVVPGNLKFVCVYRATDKDKWLC